MSKYMKCPQIRAWKFYYAYIDTNNDYKKVAEETGVTIARARQLVNKVKKYLDNGNTRVLTREMVENNTTPFYEKTEQFNKMLDKKGMLVLQ